ncbi:MAG: hypothetical protein K0M64_08040 [Rhizobium sp.]|nr:hypothetical protein [Rhizobium sp.]
MSPSTTRHAALLLAASALFSAEASAQSYLPAGPQTGVPEATVASGGWSVCHQSTYDNAASGQSMASILAGCAGENIMLACRPVGATDYTVLAQAPRTDVFFPTGNGNVPHVANGTGWYYSDSYSFGFAPEGEPLARNSCDTAGSAADRRMCVHSSAGNISGGWRCGTTTNLNGAANWERLILQTAPKVMLTVPGSNAPVTVAEELVIPPVRTFTNNDLLDIETTVEYAFSPGEVRYARLHCPGVRFDAGTTVALSGDPSNLVGAINGFGTDAIYFSITAGATPVLAGDVLSVDGDRILATKAPVDCTYGLYDVPSQAQAGGAAGRVASTSGAYLRFAPGYMLRVSSTGNPIADVESPDPSYSEFVDRAPTYDTLLGQIGGFSYGMASQVLGGLQPITIDGAPVQLADLMGAATALVFTGDFSAASEVYLSNSLGCGSNLLSADSFDDTQAVFTVGNNAALNRYLCFEAGGEPIRASEFTVALAPVSADASTYAVTDRGPLDLGVITRNGTELQAPLAQVPDNYLSRMVLTNTGSQDRAYEIAVMGETGNVISTAHLSGFVPAGGTTVVDLADVLTGFTAAPRATLNVTISGPNNQIQGLYQIVNPDSGTISNHVMERPYNPEPVFIPAP